MRNILSEPGRLKKWKRLLFAVAFVIAMNRYFFENHLLGNESIVNSFMLIMAYLVQCFSDCFCEKHLKRHCILFSVILSITIITGRLLYYYGKLDRLLFPVKEFILNVISIAGFTAVFAAVLSAVIRYLIKAEAKCNRAAGRFFRYPWLYCTVIFLSWLPCYLAYYPGVIAYDMGEQLEQALGIVPITRHHPPLHTLFVRFCLFVQKETSCNALLVYSIVQMLLLAAAFSYLIYFLVKRNADNRILIAALLFFCINPVIAVFSFIPVKDAMAAAFFVLFMTELLNLVCDRGRFSEKIFSQVRLIVFGVFSCLFRNNFVYAIILSLLFVVLLLKKWWKVFLLWIVGIGVGYNLINGPLYTAVGIQEGNVREMLSVPIQQIAYVVACHEGSLTEEIKEDIEKYLPVEELSQLYNPRFADPVKNRFCSENFQENKSGFLKLWLKLFWDYPKEYIEAFLNLNLPYWYVDACTLDSYSQRAYMERDLPENYEVLGYIFVRDYKFPRLYSAYQVLTNYATYQNLPLISNFFSISTPLWLMFFGMVFLKIQRKRAVAICFLPPMFVWLTYLLGPVSNLRYMFPIIVLYPLFGAVLLQPGRFELTQIADMENEKTENKANGKKLA